jgi:ubiquinone/menaquinone biosynthesis C-methylase UbiE
METNILKEDFNEYYQSQKNDAGTTHGDWFNQMIDAIKGIVVNKPKESKIIDIGCHKGHGLEVLKNQGFTNLLGVDLVIENVSSITEKGINGLALDMHDLSMISDKYFDIAFMSHSIEHAIDPLKVLMETTRVAKEGLIIVPIEPYATEIRNPPHYYTFRNIEEFEIMIKQVPNITYTLEPKNRKASEVWCYFKEANGQ